MTLDQLERRVRLLTRLTTVLFLLLAGVLLLAAGPVRTVYLGDLAARVIEADTLRAKVVLTGRLDVVEPDGSLALLTANSVQMPGVVLEGDTVTTRGGSAGLIFFYEGHEVGGLIYRIDDHREVPYALGHLSLDQYRHDQVALMQYEGQGERQRAGFYVNDRSPAFDLYDYKALLDSAALLPEAERRAVLQRFKTRADAGEFGGRRVALESNRRMAALRLSDWKSQERLRAVVDSAGAARIEFLDAEGKVIRIISATE
ncbi:hypothetical protein GGR26_002673 [Lewinella marina]|uniref:Uncharacterized protein n=1 Tax=Neolewinella marina TaxID=438751 RepID=A0A2G0CD48_9BACT|nr:hypothetical protein [Neolewinella marina]NJB86896.1 hypothetical protein [Neolewinella marina]PHK97906.1 hypothetical protein CGL56_13920 [Neolewinella marina]